jgi:hypothetical protein
MDLGDLWSALRGPLKENFSFSDIKEISGAGGVPVFQLGNLSQAGSGYTSKGMLLDAIDRLVNQLHSADRDRLVKICIKEMATRKPETIDSLSDALSNLGWGLSGAEPFPLSLQISAQTLDLDEETKTTINKSIRRFRDGDLSGATTAICGTVDKTTQDIFLAENAEGRPLGEHTTMGYASRVSVAFKSFEPRFKSKLSPLVNTDEVDRLWHWQLKAVQQAAEVLASYRRNFSDAHGVGNPPISFVQHALDSAIYILRSFAAYK